MLLASDLFNTLEKNMVNEILDLSFLYEVTGGEKSHIYNVIEIFLDSTDTALANLDILIQEGKWNEASRQAHAIKSSVHVINIIGMYDLLVLMERRGAEMKDTDTIPEMMKTVKKLYTTARPLLLKLQEDSKVS